VDFVLTINKQENVVTEKQKRERFYHDNTKKYQTDREIRRRW